MVEKEPMIGKISISQNGDSIMFYTLQEDEVRVKVYTMQNKEVTDITDLLKDLVAKLD